MALSKEDKERVLMAASLAKITHPELDTDTIMKLPLGELLAGIMSSYGLIERGIHITKARPVRLEGKSWLVTEFESREPYQLGDGISLIITGRDTARLIRRNRLFHQVTEVAHIEGGEIPSDWYRLIADSLTHDPLVSKVYFTPSDTSLTFKQKTLSPTPCNKTDWINPEFVIPPYIDSMLPLVDLVSLVVRGMERPSIIDRVAGYITEQLNSEPLNFNVEVKLDKLAKTSMESWPESWPGYAEAYSFWTLPLEYDLQRISVGEGLNFILADTEDNALVRVPKPTMHGEQMFNLETCVRLPELKGEFTLGDGVAREEKLRNVGQTFINYSVAYRMKKSPPISFPPKDAEMVFDFAKEAYEELLTGQYSGELFHRPAS